MTANEHQAAQPTVVELTAQEVRILQLLPYGGTIESTARQLGVAERTVRRRTRDLCDRIGLANTIQLVAWTVAAGLIHPRFERVQHPVLIVTAERRILVTDRHNTLDATSRTVQGSKSARHR